MPLNKIREGINRFFAKDDGEEYIELDLGQESKKNKVIVRPFVLRDFDNVNEILNSLREGYTIAVVDIGPLKKKDLIELKRVIAKIKKTVEALEGDIAGFGENTIIATPSFSRIYKPQKQIPQQPKKDFLQ